MEGIQWKSTQVLTTILWPHITRSITLLYIFTELCFCFNLENLVKVFRQAHFLRNECSTEQDGHQSYKQIGVNECFKILFLLNRLPDLQIILQKCSPSDRLLKLFKPFRSAEHDGRQSYKSDWVDKCLKRLLLPARWPDFQIFCTEMFLGWPKFLKQWCSVEQDGCQSYK